MNVVIRPDESVTVIGRKGTGKTSILKTMIGGAKPTGARRIVILDTKQVGDFKEYPTTTELSKVHKLAEKYPIFVYAPNRAEVKNPDYHEGFFSWAYSRWNTTVVIDELTSIVDGNDTPDSYKDITDRGRAKCVAIWQGNQKPYFVPHASLSEADHFFIFDLNMKSAREKMAGIVGPSVMNRPPHPHGFWYYHHSLSDPVYVPGMNP